MTTRVNMGIMFLVGALVGFLGAFAQLHNRDSSSVEPMRSVTEATTTIVSYAWSDERKSVVPKISDAEENYLGIVSTWMGSSGRVWERYTSKFGISFSYDPETYHVLECEDASGNPHFIELWKKEGGLVGCEDLRYSPELSIMGPRPADTMGWIAARDVTQEIVSGMSSTRYVDTVVGQIGEILRDRIRTVLPDGRYIEISIPDTTEAEVILRSVRIDVGA